MARLEDQLGWYDRKSIRAQRAYRILKLAQLVIGAAVPVVAGLDFPPYVTATISAILVVSEGVQQLYQWQTNRVLYRRAAEALKREKYMYLAGVGEYAGPDPAQKLAARIELIFLDEHAKWTETRDTGSKPRALPGEQA